MNIIEILLRSLPDRPTPVPTEETRSGGKGGR